MNFRVSPVQKLSGSVLVPSSKSHSIRAVAFASLTDGISRLRNLLSSRDTSAAISACIALGADISTEGEITIVKGFGKTPSPQTPSINTLNSGTTTSFMISIAALGNKTVVIDGDESIQKRPVQPLLSAVVQLGASARSINNNGCPPLEVRGPMKGGTAILDCKSSQYLSGLLISAPLLSENTEIIVKNVCERPYIDMTCAWLEELGIRFEREGYEKFLIYGNQHYEPFEKEVPGDWSSATFFLLAGVLLGEEILLSGLNIADTQADKEVINYLKLMGGKIEIESGKVIVRKSKLHGARLDLNNTPDALPAMAVAGCFAEGETIIENVAHARIKETDRIKVMTEELGKMGAIIEEKADGMIIHGGSLNGGCFDGHNDHRVVMALAVAALGLKGESIISTAEAANVTVPDFDKLMNSLGARIEFVSTTEISK